MTGTAEIRTFLTILLVVFVVLKLVGVIAWSWWWVLAPFWIPALIAIVAVGVMFWMIRREG